MTVPGGETRIVGYDPRYLTAFARLNREWLDRYELLEDADLEHLERPQESIPSTGGEIFFALAGDTAVGTCAALVHDPETTELAKLAVDPAARGQGIGRRLAETVIDWARRRAMRRVVLFSSTRLADALRLYERLGFEHRPLPPDTSYLTADVYMELEL